MVIISEKVLLTPKKLKTNIISMSSSLIEGGYPLGNGFLIKIEMSL
jgi:hypothetical protein